jgi:hypothetical protein
VTEDAHVLLEAQTSGQLNWTLDGPHGNVISSQSAAASDPAGKSTSSPFRALPTRPVLISSNCSTWRVLQPPRLTSSRRRARRRLRPSGDSPPRWIRNRLCRRRVLPRLRP